MHRSLVLSFALLGLAACGSSGKLIQDSLTQPEEIVAVELGSIRFDYDRWANRDENDRAVAKQNEAAWSRALGDAFLARATQRGIGGAAHRTRVDITIVDLEPGDREAREDVVTGKGMGTVSALVEPQGHGSFRMNGEITGSLGRSDFVNVMKKLGEEIADHLAKRARR